METLGFYIANLGFRFSIIYTSATRWLMPPGDDDDDDDEYSMKVILITCRNYLSYMSFNLNLIKSLTLKSGCRYYRGRDIS